MQNTYRGSDAYAGKPYKKKVSRGDQTKIPNRVGIEQRPAIADEKTEFGHFEIDTIVGRDHQSYAASHGVLSTG
ncbi:Transposase, IS30 family [Piscirickettsia salmonis]|nr:Transposase, IS30 family [Piscirickettsia salmonis]